MTSKTNTTKNTNNKTTPVSVSGNAMAIEAVQTYHADNDFKTALLIVSLMTNLFILVAWVALKVTSEFDYQVATFLFYR